MPAIGAVAPGKYPVGATDRPIVTCMFLLVATAKPGGGNNIPVMPSYIIVIAALSAVSNLTHTAYATYARKMFA